MEKIYCGLKLESMATTDKSVCLVILCTCSHDIYSSISMSAIPNLNSPYWSSTPENDALLWFWTIWVSLSTRSKPTDFIEFINNLPFISKSRVPTADIKINGINLFYRRLNNLARHSAQFLADPPALILIVPIFELFIQLSKFWFS